jgi:hypothetical protein
MQNEPKILNEFKQEQRYFVLKIKDCDDVNKTPNA